ncbi:MAG TPA: phosphatidylglycerol lysyltransferase domain-containing protein [Gaiellaceae bacterium]|nr:phosphatidylglycerol lysyltransferase domain-containing protein [Gaiellaceae bacterium]
MLRRLGAVPVTLAVALAATGWLYVVRPPLPGPRVGEALPLDELSKHAASPLLWYVAVWGVAAVALGLYARWARIERLRAALLLGTTVVVWTYLESGVSIAVVRQIAAHDAFDAAARLPATYLPFAIVALVAAGLAAKRRTAPGSPIVVATLVAAAGSLNLLHAVLPGSDDGVLRSLTPDAVGPLADATCVLLAVALLGAARGLARRRRRAWQVAVLVSGLSTLLHVLHGLNDGTLASVVVLVVLVARRHDFDRPGDEQTRAVVAVRAGVAIAALMTYGVVALWVNRVNADQPFTARFAGEEIARGALGLRIGGSPHLAGPFGDWFPLSLLLLTLSAVGWVLAGWLAPWRHRVRQEQRERELAHVLVQAWGVDTLAPFVLRADKSYFFGGSERAFLAYRVVGGVAIVSGDPIGPPAEFGALVRDFIAYAHERDWRVAILGASERWLPLYAEHGLHALYHGDEAVVDTAAFSLDGRPIRKVRQSVHRLARAGYTARVLRPSEIGPELREQLEDLARLWRDGEPERGFVMALDALFRLGDDEAVFVVGIGPDGTAAGFLHFAIAPAASALSLSSMPRLRDTPNGFNEWLICETVAWARANGYARVSLNFAPFAALLAPEAELNGLERMQRRALLSLKGRFQLDNLLAFNRKFFPRWDRRFVVYERRRDLPRVGIAALAAEAYLPFGNVKR